MRKSNRNRAACHGDREIAECNFQRDSTFAEDSILRSCIYQCSLAAISKGKPLMNDKDAIGCSY